MRGREGKGMGGKEEKRKRRGIIMYLGINDSNYIKSV